MHALTSDLRLILHRQSTSRNSHEAHEEHAQSEQYMSPQRGSPGDSRTPSRTSSAESNHSQFSRTSSTDSQHLGRTPSSQTKTFGRVASSESKPLCSPSPRPPHAPRHETRMLADPVSVGAGDVHLHQGQGISESTKSHQHHMGSHHEPHTGFGRTPSSQSRGSGTGQFSRATSAEGRRSLEVTRSHSPGRNDQFERCPSASSQKSTRSQRARSPEHPVKVI
jgi:hypothetical protein